MYYREFSPFSLHPALDPALDLPVLLLDLVLIIFLTSKDDFESLRVGILQVNLKELRLRDKKLENHVPPFSESPFSAEK